MSQFVSLGAKTIVLAALVLLAIPTTSQAQVGFFYGSGGRGGHQGGNQWGVSVGQPFYYGQPGGYYGNNFGGNPWGYNNYGYNYYPQPYYYNNYTPYTNYGATYYSDAYGMSNNNNYQQSNYPPTNQIANNAASIEVICPADAEIWFDGTKTQQQGFVRRFVTPPLGEGSNTYELRVTWKDQSGTPVTRTRQVRVTPNQHAIVSIMDGQPEANQNPDPNRQIPTPDLKTDIKKDGK